MIVTPPHRISEEPLAGVLLVLETRRGMFDVRIESPAGRALLALRDGKLVHASFGDLTGLDAARAVLRLDEGEYVIDDRIETVPEEVDARVSDLLREAGFPLEGLRSKATLAFGTGAMTAGSGNTIRSTSSGPPSPKRVDSKPPPGRWAKNAKKPERTAYSSVPPPSLAEERVPISPARAEKDRSGSDRPAKRANAVRSALTELVTASVSNDSRFEDDARLDEEVVSAAEGQLRESEMPVPSSNLGADALRQLDFLNEALGSAPRTSAPIEKLMAPFEDEGLRSSDTLHSLRAPSFHPERDDTEQLSALGSPPSSSAPPAPGSMPHPDLLPGRAASSPNALPVVGRYEVLARLKRGGMGSVYMCRMVATAGFRRLFAMKVLHSHLVHEPESVEAFFHEARVLGALHHRNIVGVIDVGSAGEPYIVLDYVEGGSLAELFRATRKRRRDPAIVVAIILDALSGLAAAHEARDEQNNLLGLVHCDVSPHNFLVGIDGTCRLTDFGAARTGPSRSEGETIQGKPSYLAPERLLRQPFDQRADVFSLGVCLYNGLTGLDLFSGNDTDETLKNVLHQPIGAPSEVGWKPPECFDRVCLRALARDPLERYQSAAHMAEELRRIAIEHGLLASSSATAGWVSEVLAPTLKARRIAAMRGSDPDKQERNWATLPPPSVGLAPDATRPRKDSPAPSATETTGPLEFPPSSRGFDDRTERTQVLGPRDEEERPRGRRMGLYLVILAALLCVVWLALRPDSGRSYFRMSPPVGEEGARTVPTSSPSDAQRPALPPDEPSEEDPDRIVIPEIQPPRPRP